MLTTRTCAQSGPSRKLARRSGVPSARGIDRGASTAVTSRGPCAGDSAVHAGAGASSSFYGARLPAAASAGHKWVMSQWLENRAEVEVPVSLEVCWGLWDNRELIPKWMPWIKSVKVQEDDPRMSRWTLSTTQFGRDWEFSWLARNLAPVRYQKIHWISEPGSASLGIELSNRGQIRFRRKTATACVVSLTIAYEVPDVLAPFGNALTPIVEGIIQRDMERFRLYALDHAEATAPA